MVHLLRIKYLHKLFRIILQGRFLAFSPFFVYSIIYLYLWTHDFFHTFANNPLLLYLCYYSDCFSFDHWNSFSGFLCLFNILHYILCVCMWAVLLCFLGLQKLPGSFCIFLAQPLESSIFPKRPTFIYWRMVIDTMI